MKENELAGKVALITGGSKGLGKAMAISLARAGAQLALVSRNAELLNETAAQASLETGQIHTFSADVTSESQINDLKDQVLGKLGHVDILINNAGINIRKPMTHFTLEEWERIMDTNLSGPFLLSRAFVPQMQARKWGRIINLTSMMSHVSLPGRSAYSASKAGLLGFTKALALELATDGITVNGISPGPIATELNRPIIENPELNNQFISRIPIGRWGKVEEVGELAVYLCSEAAGFITGTDILMDGGWSAQ